jgi:MFS family permease
VPDGSHHRKHRGVPKQTAVAALRFVLLVGVMSFFADFTYEGSRSIVGQYLSVFGASAFLIAFITGFGELLGYGLRLWSGPFADRKQRYWPVAIVGYVVQMAAVPALALANSLPTAAILVILERVGKATRNPSRDAMLSHAAKEIGFGWGFGVHEALDQFGATFGPLAVALVLTLRHGDYRVAFASLAITGAMTLVLLFVARVQYPNPQNLGSGAFAMTSQDYPRVYWVYLTGAALVAAGFADFPLIAYHFEHSHIVQTGFIPMYYAVAMAVGGLGSLLFGRLYDRWGLGVLVPLTLLGALYAPLVFLGGMWAGLVGSALWGLGMGVSESIIPAAISPLVANERRASALGSFTGMYGVAWFLGSLAIGALFGVSLVLVVVFAVGAEVLAIPIFLHVRRMISASA